jgi:hypothetical protein
MRLSPETILERAFEKLSHFSKKDIHAAAVLARHKYKNQKGNKGSDIAESHFVYTALNAFDRDMDEED